MKTTRFILAVLVLMVLPFAASAQCKGFIKKTCIPRLQPFTTNGQLNNAVMAAGETAELQMTFYSGQEYRVIICSQEVLGKVSFKVYDSGKHELFDSKNTNDPSMWDFKVTSTQQLTIEIIIPPLDSPNSIVPTGCVSVLVGFKK